MSYRSYGPQFGSGSVMDGSASDRLTFIKRTYLHLAGAIALFVLLSAAFYQAGVGIAILEWMGTSRFAWLLILGGFMVIGYIGQAMARSSRSLPAQYGGLTIYTVGEALIFTPLLAIAAHYAPTVLPQATILTLVVFFGLTAFTFLSKQDFSFLGSILAVVGFAVLGIIVVGVLFGFNLGIWFSAGMVLFASAAIVYSTSNVIRVYGSDQYVAAALDLFAAVALLFWYVLSFLLQSQRR